MKLKNQYFKILSITISIIITLSCNEFKTIDAKVNTTDSTSNDCHMCPGQIIIEHHNIKDTILSGGWGNTGIWDTFRYDNILYLHTINRYFSGGITESSLKIFKLSHKPHILIFDTLIMDKKLNRYEILKQELEFKMPNELIVKSEIEKFNDDDEASSITKNEIRVFKISYDELIKNKLN